MTKKDPVTDYAKKVVAGRIVAGPHVRQACQRHLNDLKQAINRGLFWDLEAVDHALGFFPAVLRLAAGQFEGKPFELHPSQQFIIGSLFGWKRIIPEKSYDEWPRRFRRAYIEQGKGNGKSPLAAGIGLYCMLADGEARAEVYAAASKRDQALILFSDAVAMWQQSTKLQKRIQATGQKNISNLFDLETASFFRPIAGATATSHGHGGGGQSGPRPSCALCDEIHEHRDGTTIEMLERGFKWRRQPLLIMITNSGSDRNSVCWQEHQHAVRVVSGELPYELSDSSFSYVCALDEEDDALEDPRCWAKVNPLLGVTITREYLAEVVSQAKAIPGKLNNILRLHFCQWTDSETAWMTRKSLEQVVVEPEFPEDGKRSLEAFTKQHRGKEVSAGLDLSDVQDLSAAAFAVHTGFVEVERVARDGGKRKVKAPTFDAWVEAWTPGETINERSIRDSAHYDVWARQGWLHAPDSPNIRLDFIAAHLADLSTTFRITKLAYDRYAFRRFEEELAAFNFKALLIEHPQGGKRRGTIPLDLAQEAKRTRQEMPQGLWMPGSVMELEAMILEKRIRLFGNPVLISACMAAALEPDPLNYRWFSKRRATGRIDALIALAMAIGAATMQAPKKTDVNDFLRNAVVA
jgi:phage terminase large subunit-like protein